MSILDFIKSNPGKWRSVAYSRKGRREENQDNFLIVEPDGATGWLENQQPVETQVSAWDERYARVAVLDGMGGHHNGREIAEAAAGELLNLPPQTDIPSFRGRIEAIHGNLYRIQPE